MLNKLLINFIKVTFGSSCKLLFWLSFSNLQRYAKVWAVIYQGVSRQTVSDNNFCFI